MDHRVHDDELDFDSDQVMHYRGRPFTGVSFAEESDGTRSELSHRNGLQDGPAHVWYPSGLLMEETQYRENKAHGQELEYDRSGALVRASTLEYGIIVMSTHYGPNGEVISREQIDEHSFEYTVLERYRRQLNWPLTTGE